MSAANRDRFRGGYGMNARLLRLRRGAAISAMLLVGAAAQSAPSASAATVFLVDRDQSDCTTTYNNINFANPLHQAINDAIAANKPAAILVCKGTYNVITVNNAK